MSEFESPEPPKHSFAHSAALAAVTAPVLAILLNAGAVAFSHSSIPNPSKAQIIASMIGMGLIIIGLVCAMIALCNMERFGRKGLLVRGIVGVILNGGIITVFMMGVMHGFTQGVKARQTARRDLNTAIDDVGKSARKYFDSENGITNVDYIAAEKFRRELTNAARHLDPETARVAKVSAAWIGQMELASRKLQAALNDLQAARVLDMTGVNDRQELQRRKEIANRYLGESENVRAVVTNSYTFYRAELRKLGSSPESIEKYMNGLERSAAPQRRLLVEVRDADAAMIKNMVAALDLLDTKWGRWQVDGGKILFEDSSALSAFNSHIQQITYAGKAQVEAQRKLVSLH